MSVKSQEMDRAKYAYDWIKENVVNETNEVKKCFISYVKNVPAYIKVNGIAATYAFIGTKISKKKNDTDAKAKGWRLVNEMTLARLNTCYPDIIRGTKAKLNEVFVNIDSQNYKIITKEILAFFNWARRYAESELVEACLQQEQEGGE